MVWIGSNWPFGQENQLCAKNTSFSPILVDTNLSYLTLEGPGRQTVDTRSTSGVALIPTESLRTQDSENVYERWVQQIFYPVLVGRSWVSATKWGPLAKLWAVQKNKHGHNFQNIASKTNQRGLIVYEPTLIQFGAEILKIVAVLIFFNGS